MSLSITRGKIGVEDLQFWVSGSPTFSRMTSTGGSQTLSAISAADLPVEDTDDNFTGTTVEAVLAEIADYIDYITPEHNDAGQHKSPLNCALVRAANQAISNNSWTPISWDTEVVDTGSLFSLSTPTYINLPRVGLWLITGVVTFASNSNGTRLVVVKLNGVEVFRGNNNSLNSGEANSLISFTALVVSTAVTDYVTIDVYQDSTATINVMGGTSSTRVAAVLLGVS